MGWSWEVWKVDAVLGSTWRSWQPVSESLISTDEKFFMVTNTPRSIPVQIWFSYQTNKKSKSERRWQKVGHRRERGSTLRKRWKVNGMGLAAQALSTLLGCLIYFRNLGSAISFSQPLVDFIPMFSDQEDCSHLVLFLTPCGEYLVKPSLAESHTFFEHRCTWGF